MPDAVQSIMTIKHVYTVSSQLQIKAPNIIICMKTMYKRHNIRALPKLSMNLTLSMPVISLKKNSKIPHISADAIILQAE
jgi:hypothetical protein